MPTQRKRRRGTTPQHASFTGALGEMTLDTDRDGLVAHDAVRAGGFPIPTAREAQLRHFISADAGGTADVLTLTLNEAPAAYAAHLQLGFKAASNNTGAATINVNGLGAKSLKKLDSSQVKIALAADDLVSGRFYTITYDGTDFVVGGGGLGGAGVMVELASTEVTGSDAVSVDFPNVFNDSTYAYYILSIVGARPDTGTTEQLALRFREAGAWKSGASDYAFAESHLTTGGSSGIDTNDSISELVLSDNQVTTARRPQTEVNIFQPESTSVPTTVYFSGFMNAIRQAYWGGGSRKTTAAATGVQVIFAGGAKIQIGAIISVYGIKK